MDAQLVDDPNSNKKTCGGIIMQENQWMESWNDIQILIDLLPVGWQTPAPANTTTKKTWGQTDINKHWKQWTYQTIGRHACRSWHRRPPYVWQISLCRRKPCADPNVNGGKHNEIPISIGHGQPNRWTGATTKEKNQPNINKHIELCNACRPLRNTEKKRQTMIQLAL